MQLIVQDDLRPPRKTMNGDIFAFGRICLSVSLAYKVHAIHLKLNLGVHTACTFFQHTFGGVRTLEGYKT
jgi:hypothetical protein